MNTPTKHLRQRISVNAHSGRFSPNWGADLSAGLVSAVVGVPQGMAFALIAGVNPIYGLYTAIVGTLVAGLTTSSSFMNVALTNTLALAVGSALADFSGDVKVERLFALTCLVGLIQLGFGLARLGDLTRFVSNGVMTGFIAGSALLIITGQFVDLTGYLGVDTGAMQQWFVQTFPTLNGNNVLEALNTIFNPLHMNPYATLIGVTSIVSVILLQRTRLKTFAMIVVLALASLAANLLNAQVDSANIELVSDIAQIPPGLPAIQFPNLFSGGFVMLYSAIAVAILGMVQTASVSQSVPNPGGEDANVSRDFTGIGVANIAGSFFQGMPAGGSFSGTALNVSAGARSRWANIFAGAITGVIVLLFGSLVERIAMPAMAGILILIGIQALPLGAMRKVWKTNPSARISMIVTLGATLSIPVQNAIYLGIVLSLGLFIYTSSRRIRVVQIIKNSAGLFEELPAPAKLPDHAVTLLNIYGNLYFGAISTLEKNLPGASGTRRSVVILRLRGRESLGSTLHRLLERYTQQVQAGGGRLMLVGIDPELHKELVQTGTIDVLGEENVFLATNVLAESSEHAVAVATKWLESLDEPEKS